MGTSMCVLKSLPNQILLKKLGLEWPLIKVPGTVPLFRQLHLAVEAAVGF